MISAQADALLGQLEKLGIYGKTKSEIAGRFIEQVLQTLVERPQLPIPTVYTPSVTAAPRVAEAAPVYRKPTPRRPRRGQT